MAYAQDYIWHFGMMDVIAWAREPWEYRFYSPIPNAAQSIGQQSGCAGTVSTLTKAQPCQNNLQIKGSLGKWGRKSHVSYSQQRRSWPSTAPTLLGSLSSVSTLENMFIRGESLTHPDPQCKVRMHKDFCNVLWCRRDGQPWSLDSYNNIRSSMEYSAVAIGKWCGVLAW